MGGIIKFMKRLLLFFIIISSLYFNSFSQNYWQQILYPDSVEIWAVNVEFSDNIFIGAKYPPGGIYKSDYNFFNWEYKGPEIATVYDISINTYGIIYISSKGIVYKSVDNGDTWIDIFSCAPYNNLVSIEIDSNDGIWVGSWGQIFHSDDLGVSWDTCLVTSTDEVFADFAFGLNGEIYAVSQHFTANEGGFYVSYDNGLTWENPGLNGKAAKSIEVNSNNTIFVGTYYHGIFKSDDNGISWENIFEYIDAVALLVDGEDNIYLGANREIASPKGVWMSDDDGLTWDTINQIGLTNKYVNGLYLDTYGHLYSLSKESYGHQLFRTLNPVTAIESGFISSYVDYSLFPNPCKDWLTIITGNQKVKDGYYDIFNVHGQKLSRNIKITSSQQSINTSNLKSGSYFIRVYSDTYQKIIPFQKF
jgi:ligand-binding sensor domain-containing protein